LNVWLGLTRLGMDPRFALCYFNGDIANCNKIGAIDAIETLGNLDEKAEDDECCA